MGNKVQLLNNSQGAPVTPARNAVVMEGKTVEVIQQNGLEYPGWKVIAKLFLLFTGVCLFSPLTIPISIYLTARGYDVNIAAWICGKDRLKIMTTAEFAAYQAKSN